MPCHSEPKTHALDAVVQRAKKAGKAILGHPRITGLGRRVTNDILRPQLARRVRQPEKIIRFAFDTFVPVSSTLIEEALCNAFNAAPPTPEAIIANYCQGAVLFGKHNSDILHWKIAPERAAITRASANIPKSLKKLMRSGRFSIRYNNDFEAVILGSRRREGSWISDPLVELYVQLFERKAAWCLEAYQADSLVAGNWGIKIGGVCAGMSTFSQVSDAGSLLVADLVVKLMDGEFDMIDCGAPKPHFRQFGARAMKRAQFIAKVAQCIDSSHRCWD